ncbi:MAG: hypothetical protein J7L90_02485 [Dehalococcoidia bacterium]|nr:hypothetical protein [Dehalococcoidia bacterium]
MKKKLNIFLVALLGLTLLIGAVGCSEVEDLMEQAEEYQQKAEELKENVDEIKGVVDGVKEGVEGIVPTSTPDTTNNSSTPSGSIAMNLESWIKVNEGEWEETADGVKVYGAGYRFPHQGLQSKVHYNFINSETFIKWKANGGSGAYSAFWVFLMSDYDPVAATNSGSVSGGYFTTDHSWKNSTVITEDVWYYTRIAVNADSTYTAVTSTGDYDTEGGSPIYTGSGTYENADNGNIVVVFNDNYGGTETYVVVGEARTNASPVTATSAPTPTPSANCVHITDSIAGTHQPSGVFFTNTVTLDVPEQFDRIVMAQNCDGVKAIGIDDEARVTVTSPSGHQQVGTINKNGSSGQFIGEQWVLSNVIDFEPGLNQIAVELVNVFAPPGSNASSSSIYIVVLSSTPATTAAPESTPTVDSGEKVVLVWLQDGVRNATMNGILLEKGKDNEVEINYGEGETCTIYFEYTDEWGREQETTLELDAYYDYFILLNRGGWSSNKYRDAYESEKTALIG